MTQLMTAICLAICLALLVLASEAWVASVSPLRRRCQPSARESHQYRREHWQHVILLASNSPPDVETESASVSGDLLEDLDAPAGIGGAEFFGGSTEKQEFYDPVAEAKAGEELEASGTLDRFSITASKAFDSEATAAFAKLLQEAINGVMSASASASSTSFAYALNLVWETPLIKTKSNHQPLQELQAAKEFYRQIHVAVTGGRAIPGAAAGTFKYELRWEISLLWPIFWEPRILLTGSSRFIVKGNGNETEKRMIITKQTDMLDDSDLLASMTSQWLPRFWDVYHIGMTPVCELSPKLPSSSRKSSFLPKSYELLDLPPRWYVQASLDDLWDRNDGTASTIPNHAFATAIKTMGPQKQDYTPCSPIQISISNSKQQTNRVISWLIPVAVETLAANMNLLLPGPDPEMMQEAMPQSTYVYVPERRVATVPYAGPSPQDEEIAAVRKRLYEQVVVQDGYKPKLDADGRPVFFFWQETVKACYTTDGLGMAVYEWRPQFTNPCRVGLELEYD